MLLLLAEHSCAIRAQTISSLGISPSIVIYCCILVSRDCENVILLLFVFFWCDGSSCAQPAKNAKTLDSRIRKFRPFVVETEFAKAV